MKKVICPIHIRAHVARVFFEAKDVINNHLNETARYNDTFFCDVSIFTKFQETGYNMQMGKHKVYPNLLFQKLKEIPNTYVEIKVLPNRIVI